MRKERLMSDIQKLIDNPRPSKPAKKKKPRKGDDAS